MSLKIITFGPCVTAGLPQSITLPYTSSLKSVLSALLKTYPNIKELPKIEDGKVKGEWCIAINSSYVYDDVEIMETDEIAVIPPISGG
ncbi:hypothetical protein TrVE_jg13348 [Triparma verrucosa]|uniref:Molybdopterin synthase sulfur carrier subunit n=1 Tax=Triparma verrucosa TaxID=1606542 RepID=A0A9W7C550_9STRA|nr:hypothetical protein TrVE_jg13348 [Triparma verrucosa]